MKTPISVKQATIDNLNGISELFNEYRIFYKQDSDLEGARKFIFDRFEHKESIIFVAIENETDKSIGFSQLYPTFSSLSMKRSFILNDLYVREEFRNRGIAKKLLEAAKSYAVLTKAKGIELATAMNNDNAQRLYENFGFKKDEDFYHYFYSL